MLGADIRRSQEPSFSMDAKGQPTGTSDSYNTAQFFASMVMLFTQASSLPVLRLKDIWPTRGKKRAPQHLDPFIGLILSWIWRTEESSNNFLLLAVWYK